MILESRLILGMERKWFDRTTRVACNDHIYSVSPPHQGARQTLSTFFVPDVQKMG